MKKKLMLAIMILAPFVVIMNASALTSEEEVYIDNALSYYNSEYPYCSYFRRKAGSRDMNDIFCFKNKPNVSCVSNNGYKCDFSNYGLDYLDINFITNYENVLPEYSSSIKTNSANFQYVNYSGYSLSNIYSNCSLVDSNNNVIFDDFSFGSNEPIIYTITFNPPKNTIIEVKDSDNNIIQPESQYIYKLESGSYTYSATNNLYQTLNNITFQVLEDVTINVEMEEKLQSQPIRSVYTQYYNYISELVSKVFDIENPIFLFFISFIIGFSLIVLLKKLIGGIL